MMLANIDGQHRIDQFIDCFAEPRTSGPSCIASPQLLDRPARASRRRYSTGMIVPGALRSPVDAA